jgi:hypothetical protein
MPIKNEALDFSDMSGGKNSAFPRHALAKNQVSDTLNAIHHTIGTSRAPGYSGLVNTAMFSKPIRGQFKYIKDDGTEIAIVISDKKINVVTLADGSLTEIGSGLITADTQCYAVNAAGKLWIVNGTDFVKIESETTAYRVQIIAPASGTVTAIAGGTLPDGVYGCYAAYARKNAAGQYFYSLPRSLGNVTLGTGSNTIRIAIPNSADTQVTHKVAFITDASGTVQYYYGEATNAIASFDITSAVNRNASILMSVVSAANQILPITPNAIQTFDDKLFVWDINDRTIYWSLKTDVNPFDMERFLAQNFRTLSYTVNAIFPVGEDLFFNHMGNGISKAISGDMSSIIKLVNHDFWYLDCITSHGKGNVEYFKGMAIGLTNDGFRFFDGSTFSEDLSFQIKPDVDSIYAGISTSFLPSAIVYRRANKRTEFRFSYRNLDYGTTNNNDQRVFNLDFYFDPVSSKKTWECWENGFYGMMVIAGQWYGTQSLSTGSHVVRESGVSDIYCYDRTGTFQAVTFKKQLYILSRTVIDDLDAIFIAGPVYTLATSAGLIDGNFIFFDQNNAKFPFQFSGISPQLAILPSEISGGGLEIPFTMNPQYPVSMCDPLTFEARGNSIAIEISQVEDDTEFFLYKISLPKGKQVKNNMT